MVCKWVMMQGMLSVESNGYANAVLQLPARD